MFAKGDSAISASPSTLETQPFPSQFIILRATLQVQYLAASVDRLLINCRLAGIDSRLGLTGEERRRGPGLRRTGGPGTIAAAASESGYQSFCYNRQQ